MCLNEFHVFLLMEGAFIGYCYSLLYFANNFNYLSFPTMQVRNVTFYFYFGYADQFICSKYLFILNIRHPNFKVRVLTCYDLKCRSVALYLLPL